jgi:hypothetical protein
MFDWEDFDQFFGHVLATTMTCDTNATLMVAPAGKRLKIYKIYVDGPSEPPPILFQYT